MKKMAIGGVCCDGRRDADHGKDDKSRERGRKIDLECKLERSMESGNSAWELEGKHFGCGV